MDNEVLNKICINRINALLNDHTTIQTILDENNITDDLENISNLDYNLFRNYICDNIDYQAIIDEYRHFNNSKINDIAIENCVYMYTDSQEFKHNCLSLISKYNQHNIKNIEKELMDKNDNIGDAFFTKYNYDFDHRERPGILYDGKVYTGEIGSTHAQLLYQLTNDNRYKWKRTSLDDNKINAFFNVLGDVCIVDSVLNNNNIVVPVLKNKYKKVYFMDYIDNSLTRVANLSTDGINTLFDLEDNIGDNIDLQTDYVEINREKAFVICQDKIYTGITHTAIISEITSNNKEKMILNALRVQGLTHKSIKANISFCVGHIYGNVAIVEDDTKHNIDNSKIISLLKEQGCTKIYSADNFHTNTITRIANKIDKLIDKYNDNNENEIHYMSELEDYLYDYGYDEYEVEEALSTGVLDGLMDSSYFDIDDKYFWLSDNGYLYSGNDSEILAIVNDSSNEDSSIVYRYIININGKEYGFIRGLDLIDDINPKVLQRVNAMLSTMTTPEVRLLNKNSKCWFTEKGNDKYKYVINEISSILDDYGYEVKCIEKDISSLNENEYHIVDDYQVII